MSSLGWREITAAERTEWRRRAHRAKENEDRVWTEIDKAKEKIFEPQSAFDYALVPFTAVKGLILSGMALMETDPWHDSAIRQRNEYRDELLRKYGRDKLDGADWWQ